MSTSLLLGCFWVLAATGVAMLPMRRQMWPGLALLVSAPVLIGYVAVQHGWIWALPCVLAFLSTMRNPLRYLWKRLRGQQPELPAELRK